MARILNRNGDKPATTKNFSDGNQESDHRPVDAVLTFEPVDDDPGEEGADDRLDEILRILEDMDARLRRIEDLIDD